MMVWKMIFLFQGARILRYLFKFPGWIWFEKKNAIHCWCPCLQTLSFRTAPWIFKSPVFTWMFLDSRCGTNGKIPRTREKRRKDRRGGIGLSIHPSINLSIKSINLSINQSINPSIHQSNQIKSNHFKPNPIHRADPVCTLEERSKFAKSVVGWWICWECGPVHWDIGWGVVHFT